LEKRIIPSCFMSTTCDIPVTDSCHMIMTDKSRDDNLGDIYSRIYPNIYSVEKVKCCLSQRNRSICLSCKDSHDYIKDRDCVLCDDLLAGRSCNTCRGCSMSDDEILVFDHCKMPQIPDGRNLLPNVSDSDDILISKGFNTLRDSTMSDDIPISDRDSNLSDGFQISDGRSLRLNDSVGDDIFICDESKLRDDSIMSDDLQMFGGRNTHRNSIVSDDILTSNVCSLVLANSTSDDILISDGRNIRRKSVMKNDNLISDICNLRRDSIMSDDILIFDGCKLLRDNSISDDTLISNGNKMRHDMLFSDDLQISDKSDDILISDISSGESLGDLEFDLEIGTVLSSSCSEDGVSLLSFQTCSSYGQCIDIDDSDDDDDVCQWCSCASIVNNDSTEEESGTDGEEKSDYSTGRISPSSCEILWQWNPSYNECSSEVAAEGIWVRGSSSQVMACLEEGEGGGGEEDEKFKGSRGGGGGGGVKIHCQILLAEGDATGLREGRACAYSSSSGSFTDGAVTTSPFASSEFEDIITSIGRRSRSNNSLSEIVFPSHYLHLDFSTVSPSPPSGQDIPITPVVCDSFFVSDPSSEEIERRESEGVTDTKRNEGGSQEVGGAKNRKDESATPKSVALLSVPAEPSHLQNRVTLSEDDEILTLRLQPPGNDVSTRPFEDLLKPLQGDCFNISSDPMQVSDMNESLKKRNVMKMKLPDKKRHPSLIDRRDEGDPWRGDIEVQHRLHVSQEAQILSSSLENAKKKKHRNLASKRRHTSPFIPSTRDDVLAEDDAGSRVGRIARVCESLKAYPDDVCHLRTPHSASVTFSEGDVKKLFRNQNKSGKNVSQVPYGNEDIYSNNVIDSFISSNSSSSNSSNNRSSLVCDISANNDFTAHVTGSPLSFPNTPSHLSAPLFLPPLSSQHQLPLQCQGRRVPGGNMRVALQQDLSNAPHASNGTRETKRHHSMISLVDRPKTLSYKKNKTLSQDNCAKTTSHLELQSFARKRNSKRFEGVNCFNCELGNDERSKRESISVGTEDVPLGMGIRGEVAVSQEKGVASLGIDSVRMPPELPPPPLPPSPPSSSPTPPSTSKEGVVVRALPARVLNVSDRHSLDIPLPKPFFNHSISTMPFKILHEEIIHFEDDAKEKKLGSVCVVDKDKDEPSVNYNREGVTWRHYGRNECQVPKQKLEEAEEGEAGILCDGGRWASGSCGDGTVGEAHDVAPCVGQVIGTVQVLVGETECQYPLYGTPEKCHDHEEEDEKQWVLNVPDFSQESLSILSVGEQLVTMSADRSSVAMGTTSAPTSSSSSSSSPSSPRPLSSNTSRLQSSLYGFKISNSDHMYVRNLIPLFNNSKSSSARDIHHSVSFRVKGDSSWQNASNRAKRNSDVCDMYMYRETDGKEDSVGRGEHDDLGERGGGFASGGGGGAGVIKLCGVSLGSRPSSPEPSSLFHFHTLPRKSNRSRLSSLPLSSPTVLSPLATKPSSLEFVPSAPTSPKLPLVLDNSPLTETPEPLPHDVMGQYIFKTMGNTTLCGGDGDRGVLDGARNGTTTQQKLPISQPLKLTHAEPSPMPSSSQPPDGSSLALQPLQCNVDDGKMEAVQIEVKLKETYPKSDLKTVNEGKDHENAEFDRENNREKQLLPKETSADKIVINKDHINKCEIKKPVDDTICKAGDSKSINKEVDVLIERGKPFSSNESEHFPIIIETKKTEAEDGNTKRQTSGDDVNSKNIVRKEQVVSNLTQIQSINNSVEIPVSTYNGGCVLNIENELCTRLKYFLPKIDADLSQNTVSHNADSKLNNFKNINENELRTETEVGVLTNNNESTSEIHMPIGLFLPQDTMKEKKLKTDTEIIVKTCRDNVSKMQYSQCMKTEDSDKCADGDDGEFGNIDMTQHAPIINESSNHSDSCSDPPKTGNVNIESVKVSDINSSCKVDNKGSEDKPLEIKHRTDISKLESALSKIGDNGNAVNTDKITPMPSTRAEISQTSISTSLKSVTPTIPGTVAGKGNLLPTAVSTDLALPSSASETVTTLPLTAAVAQPTTAFGFSLTTKTDTAVPSTVVTLTASAETVSTLATSPKTVVTIPLTTAMAPIETKDELSEICIAPISPVTTTTQNPASIITTESSNSVTSTQAKQKGTATSTTTAVIETTVPLITATESSAIPLETDFTVTTSQITTAISAEAKPILTISQTIANATSAVTADAHPTLTVTQTIANTTSAVTAVDVVESFLTATTVVPVTTTTTAKTRATRTTDVQTKADTLPTTVNIKETSTEEKTTASAIGTASSTSPLVTVTSSSVITEPLDGTDEKTFDVGIKQIENKINKAEQNSLTTVILLTCDNENESGKLNEKVQKEIKIGVDKIRENSKNSDNISEFINAHDVEMECESKWCESKMCATKTEYIPTVKKRFRSDNKTEEKSKSLYCEGMTDVIINKPRSREGSVNKECPGGGGISRGAGISERAALITRHQQGARRTRTTHFPLDIICNTKMQYQQSRQKMPNFEAIAISSPMDSSVATSTTTTASSTSSGEGIGRLRLSSLGQVEPVKGPGGSGAVRSKSASRIGSEYPQREEREKKVINNSKQDVIIALDKSEEDSLNASLACPPIAPLDETLTNKINTTIDSYIRSQPPLLNSLVSEASGHGNISEDGATLVVNKDCARSEETKPGDVLTWNKKNNTNAVLPPTPFSDIKCNDHSIVHPNTHSADKINHNDSYIASPHNLMDGCFVSGSNEENNLALNIGSGQNIGEPVPPQTPHSLIASSPATTTITSTFSHSSPTTAITTLNKTECNQSCDVTSQPSLSGLEYIEGTASPSSDRHRLPLLSYNPQNILFIDEGEFDVDISHKEPVIVVGDSLVNENQTNNSDCLLDMPVDDKICKSSLGAILPSKYSFKKDCQNTGLIDLPIDDEILNRDTTKSSDIKQESKRIVIDSHVPKVIIDNTNKKTSQEIGLGDISPQISQPLQDDILGQRGNAVLLKENNASDTAVSKQMENVIKREFIERASGHITSWKCDSKALENAEVTVKSIQEIHGNDISSVQSESDNRVSKSDSLKYLSDNCEPSGLEPEGKSLITIPLVNDFESLVSSQVTDSEDYSSDKFEEIFESVFNTAFDSSVEYQENTPQEEILPNFSEREDGLTCHEIIVEIDDTTASVYPENHIKLGTLERDESVDEYEQALEVVTPDPGHGFNHSSASVATIVRVDTPNRTQKPPSFDDDEADDEFVDATENVYEVKIADVHQQHILKHSKPSVNELLHATNTSYHVIHASEKTQTETNTLPPCALGIDLLASVAERNTSESYNIHSSPSALSPESFHPVHMKQKEGILMPEDGSASSGGHITDPDMLASASASSTGSEMSWTSGGGPVARRDLLPLDEDEDEVHWRALLAVNPPESDEERTGYESDEDFDTMDAEMRRLEEKLRHFQRELGENNEDGNISSEGKPAGGVLLLRSQDLEALRISPLPEVYPAVCTAKTKHLSLMSRLQVQEYEESCSGSESDSDNAASSEDSADFLFVKTKVKLKPGDRRCRSLDQKRPKNENVLNEETDKKVVRKDESCICEENLNLSSLALPGERVDDDSLCSGYNVPDQVEIPPPPDFCNTDNIESESCVVTCLEDSECLILQDHENNKDSLHENEGDLLLGYIWHEDDGMAAVDFEGVEDFSGYEGQGALLIMFEDDMDEETFSEINSFDDKDLSPIESPQMEGSQRADTESETVNSCKSSTKSERTFVSAFKNSLKKASKYLGPNLENPFKKVGTPTECHTPEWTASDNNNIMTFHEQSVFDYQPTPSCFEDTGSTGVYNVQSGKVTPAQAVASYCESDGVDIQSCSSGEYFASPAMCVNTSDEDPVIHPAPNAILPPAPPPRWVQWKPHVPKEFVSSNNESYLEDISWYPPPVSNALPQTVKVHHEVTSVSLPSPLPPPIPPPVDYTQMVPLGDNEIQFCLVGVPNASHVESDKIFQMEHMPSDEYESYSINHCHSLTESGAVSNDSTHGEFVHDINTPSSLIGHSGCSCNSQCPSQRPLECDNFLPSYNLTEENVTSHHSSHKPTSVKQLKRKQQEKILRNEAEEGVAAMGCTFCMGVPITRARQSENSSHWRQPSPHPKAITDRRSWPPRVSFHLPLVWWSLPSFPCQTSYCSIETFKLPLQQPYLKPVSTLLPEFDKYIHSQNGSSTNIPSSPSCLPCVIPAALEMQNLCYSQMSVNDEGGCNISTPHGSFDSSSSPVSLTPSSFDSDPYWMPLVRQQIIFPVLNAATNEHGCSTSIIPMLTPNIVLPSLDDHIPAEICNNNTNAHLHFTPEDHLTITWNTCSIDRSPYDSNGESSATPLIQTVSPSLDVSTQCDGDGRLPYMISECPVPVITDISENVDESKSAERKITLENNLFFPRSISTSALNYLNDSLPLMHFYTLTSYSCPLLIFTSVLDIREHSTPISTSSICEDKLKPIEKRMPPASPLTSHALPSLRLDGSSSSSDEWKKFTLKYSASESNMETDSG
ncbi:hypothetical protein SK128_023628, partial [Halocaridina rubra]